MRLAWFSPMPPVRTGIAACSAELVAGLRHAHELDVFVDVALVARTDQGAGTAGVRSAHDFLWLHRQRPYDLTVYQLGNSSHHDYLWPYLFRHPGLTVMHDAQLHHARAAALLRTGRPSHYRAEFARNHPDVSRDAAELAVAGFDNHLYYMWPMTRLVVEASKVTAVHSPQVAAELRSELPGAAVESIRLGHGVLVDATREADARTRVRARHGIAVDAVLFGCFGGLTPDKRIPQVLEAFAALLPYSPGARLILGGAAAAHYDPAADVKRLGLEGATTITGYLESDDELTDCISACDITLNLRWPTARELSGPWLRSLAAGKATVVVDLAHMTEVPSLDPRTWTVNYASDPRPAGCEPQETSPEPRTANPDPITIAVDILDEDHSLRLAMRRLAIDGGLRRALGRAGQQWWERNHSVTAMLEDYQRVIAIAASRPAPRVELPPHLADAGERVLREIVQAFGIESPL